MTCSLSDTFLATLSMSGILKCSPVCQVCIYVPSLSMTNAFACGTILMFVTISKITMMIMMITMMLENILLSPFC